MTVYDVNKNIKINLFGLGFVYDTQVKFAKNTHPNKLITIGMDDEEFWNNSNIRSFSFDEDDRVSFLF